MCTCSKCGSGIPVGPPGLNGSCGVVSILYAALLALKNAGTLIPGTIYFISDRNIYVQADSVNGIALAATYKATNADYNNATGNFIGVWKGTISLTFSGMAGYFNKGNIITGATSGATAEVIVDDRNGASVVCLISKNGIAFQTPEPISNGLGSSAVAVTETDTSLLSPTAGQLVAWNNIHYQNLTGSTTIKHPKYDVVNWVALGLTDASYQIEYDAIFYDFVNDLIVERKDKRANKIDMKNLVSFQWGNNSCFGHTILDSDFDGANARLGQSDLFVHNSHIAIYEDVVISYSKVFERSTVCVFGSNYSRTMTINHANLTVWGGGISANDTLDRYATLIVQPGTIAGDTKITNAVITTTGSTVLAGCEIDGGDVAISATFNNENHSNKYFKRGYSSNFEKSISVANTGTSLALDTSLIYGVYYLTITGGNKTIATVANLPTDIETTVILAGSNNATINNGTGAGNVRMRGSANTTLVATGGPDWISLKTFNGIIYETNIFQH